VAACSNCMHQLLPVIQFDTAANALSGVIVHIVVRDWSVIKPLNVPHFRSTVPTAFAGYSFHAAEAALVFANEIIVVFLFPIHAGLHRAYHLFTTLIHLGESATGSLQQA
jgi:hypothetical protein